MHFRRSICFPIAGGDVFVTNLSRSLNSLQTPWQTNPHVMVRLGSINNH